MTLRRLRSSPAPRIGRHADLAREVANTVVLAVVADIEALGLGPALWASQIEDRSQLILDVTGSIHAVIPPVPLFSIGALGAQAPDGGPWMPLSSGPARDARRAAHHERLVAAVVAEIDRLGLGPSTQRLDRDRRLRIYDRDRRVHAVIGRWAEHGDEEVARTLYGSLWPPSGRSSPEARPPHAYDEHPLTLAVVRSIEARGARVVTRCLAATGALELYTDDHAPGLRIGLVRGPSQRGASELACVDVYGQRWSPWRKPGCDGVSMGGPTSLSMSAAFD